MRGSDKAVSGTLTDFSYIRALRPFSFPVALISCLTGIVLAYLDGYGDLWRSILILLAGLFAQAGVNLINDLGDWAELKKYQSRTVLNRVRTHALWGMFSFACAGAIALYLLQGVDNTLFAICLIGFIGALGYSLPPIDFKSRGLAVILVFWLMGVLMVLGAYIALGGSANIKVALLSVPISLLVSALLLSNELRDFENDRSRALRTLSVRIGLSRAIALFYLIIFLSLTLPFVGWFLGLIANPLWLVPALLLLPDLLRKVSSIDARERSNLPPKTARFLMFFGLLYQLALVL